LARIGLWLAIGMRLWSNPSGAGELRGQAVSALRGGTSLGAIVARRTDTLVQPEAQRLRVEGQPESDDEAIAALEGSPHSPVCTWTYREWRELGASIAAALIRAGEAARDADRP
jgi:hypothetical protein